MRRARRVLLSFVDTLRCRTLLHAVAVAGRRGVHPGGGGGAELVGDGGVNATGLRVGLALAEGEQQEQAQGQNQPRTGPPVCVCLFEKVFDSSFGRQKKKGCR